MATQTIPTAVERSFDISDLLLRPDRSLDRKYDIVLTIELTQPTMTALTVSQHQLSQDGCNLSFQTPCCVIRILYGTQTMLSLKRGDVDSTPQRSADTQQKFEKRCIWRSACVSVEQTARRVERCQSSSAHLSHQGGFAAGPLRQHLLGWMVLVERGPQRPDGWLELGERGLRVRDTIQRLRALVLLLV